MTFKNILIIIFFSVFITACSMNKTIQENIMIKKKESLERPTVSTELLSDINHILFLLQQNDLETLNSRFIHPIFSYYELIKNQEEKIIIEKKLLIDEINRDIESFEIKQEEAIFNCSPYDDSYFGWNKEGVFLNTSKDLNISSIMEKQNLQKPNLFIKEEIKQAVLIEKTSYEVIIPYNIIFYITLIDKQWYITLIDKIKTDCTKSDTNNN